MGYDVIRRRIYEKSKGDDMAALMAELEALKAEKEKNVGAPVSDNDNIESSDQNDVPKE